MKNVISICLLIFSIGNGFSQYCSLSGWTNYCGGTHGGPILNVNYLELNNSSSCSSETSTAFAYTNYSSLGSPSINKGNTFRLNVTVDAQNSTPQTYYVAVWIDFNGDQDFNDSGEFIELGSVYTLINNTAPNPQIISGCITVPLTAFTGTTRMRIRSKRSVPVQSTESCTLAQMAYRRGEVEDYSLSILDPDFCQSTGCASVAEIASSHATLNWDSGASSNVSTYEYYLSTTSAVPTESTIVTGEVPNGNYSAIATNLTPSTTYYGWIRSNCSGNKSIWMGPVVFTTCGTLSVPYIENFDAEFSLPDCSVIREMGTDATTWTIQNNTSHVASSTNSLQCASSNLEGSNDWWFTKGIDLVEGNTYTVSWSSQVENDVYPQALKVALMNGQHSSMLFYELMDNVNFVNTTFNVTSVNFTCTQTGIYYLGFRAHAASGANRQFLDDVSIVINSSPLPVTLLQFSASKTVDGMVKLNWLTDSEINNDYFLIERAGFENPFETIALIDGKGNSNVVNSYTVFDDRPYSGLNYYRLVQVDFNGKKTYSKPVVIDFSELNPLVEVFPNPNKGDFTISIYANRDKLISFHLFNEVGELEDEFSRFVEKGVTQINYSNQLSVGIHYLKIETDLDMQVKKIVTVE